MAFTSSGAGDMLKEWYDGAFEKTTEDALANSEEYGEGAVEDFEADYADRKDQKAGQIDRKRDREANNKTKSINNAKDGHIDDLEGSKEEILAGMEQDIYNVYMDAWLKVQAKADEAEALLNNDMNGFATAEGEAAVEQLNIDLTKAKEDAVSDLEDAIEDAQAELSAELEDQGDILENNINGQIDHELEKLKSNVIDTLYDLTKAQENIIEEKAALLEDEAKDAMDDVIGNMNN